ncbi:sn-glycerol-3-phosphate transport system permease protein UgpE [Agromyces rhizosphaerae]|uniref:Sn-glycerol-3-phosphate transport system permease protein UgpE n=1 Tax=Agromyces rhizosphaerae TaxID=88374 RepID=A0A9W6FQB6_9MICO|nr:carbohydrate ABC transporter permease [Agromyces rhizosphaerae]GLI26432.1 sn-glycerol-3-phosphate transport system permease protein UgpE [Agromyces rhizosphaerae]
MRRTNPRTLASRGLSYLLLSAVALVSLGPILWMVSASFKSPNEILRYPPTIIPENFKWENYQQVFELQPFAQQFLNSVYIMALVAVLTILLSVPAGYALARVRPVAAGVIFLVLLSAMFIPPEATIIPLFQMASTLGWIDTHYPLVIFTAVLTTAPIATFVMRQAFLTLPAEFEEAATIDGATRLRTMLQIYFPLARPSLASVTVLACWYSWNQFLEPLIYVRSPEMLTVPVALTRYEDAFAGPLWGVQMAATTLSVIPVLLVFFFAQRHVVSGLTAGGLKS